MDCGCYSEYLSERDGESFKSLFSAFGVVDNIKYGTFNYLCEQLLNKHGEVRALVEARLNNAPVQSTACHGKQLCCMSLPLSTLNKLNIHFIYFIFT